MQFKNPEVFYFLFIALIPLLVHLFQFQKFVKVPFTNVAFLQKIEAKSRKSSTLKKWLLLAIRTLGLLALLFAFAQPYWSSRSIKNSIVTNIYLDNSLSLSAKNEKGQLLQNAINELIESVSNLGKYNLVTNNSVVKNLSSEDLKKELLSVQFSTKKKEIKDILVGFSKNLQNKSNTLYKNILITDLQGIDTSMFTNVNTDFSLITLQNSTFSNLSVTEVTLTNSNNELSTLNVSIRNQGPLKKNVPIALYNQKKLVAKQTFSIEENSTTLVSFTTKTNGLFLGELKLTFSDIFDFDNTFYFSLNIPSKTKVIRVGADENFLSRIYSPDEFAFTATSVQNLNYNELDSQDVIILNEIKSIPPALSAKLIGLVENGKSVVYIPSGKSTTNEMAGLLRKFTSYARVEKKLDSSLISKINFDHPFFKQVFTKKTNNFQYPFAKESFNLSAKAFNSIISFQDNRPFFGELSLSNGAFYVFGSPLSKENSNIQNSPLIVPLFYTIGKLSYKEPKPFYHINTDESFEVKTVVKNDNILSVSHQKERFIPIQKVYQDKVQLSFKEQEVSVGFYAIEKETDTLSILAMNAPQDESELNFMKPDSLKNLPDNISVYYAVDDAFTEINNDNKVNWLWKWFISLAIVSLLVEILLLKFFKV